MAGLQTEYAFTLPKGYIDRDGVLHRQGTMRLATARDEMEPLRDARINSVDDPYLTILVLARVITELGDVRQITPAVIEGLFAADLAFLQDLYGIINFGDPADVEVLQQAATGTSALGSPASSVAALGSDAAGAEGTMPAAAASNGPDDPAAGDPEAPFRRRDRIEEVRSVAER